MRKGLRAFAVACLAILSTSFFSLDCAVRTASAAGQAEAVDRVVAVVDGEYITLFELNEAFKPFLERFKEQPIGPREQAQIEDLRRKLLDRMINDVLLKSEVERLKITVSDAELNESIEDIKRRTNMSEEDLNRRLKLEGLTRKEYETRMREDMTKQRLLAVMVRRKALVTPEEIEKFYESNRGKLERSGDVDLGVILLGPDTDPEKLYADISSGKTSFEEAAKARSKGPGAAQGGALGKMSMGDLNPEWRAALQGVKPGGISRPFKVGEFTAILKLKGQSEPGAAKPEPASGVPPEAREEIREILMKQKMDEIFNEYMERLRAKSVIEVRL